MSLSLEKMLRPLSMTTVTLSEVEGWNEEFYHRHPFN